MRRAVTPTALVLAAAVGLGGFTAARGVRAAPAIAAPSFTAVRAAYEPSDARLLDRRGEVVHELRVDPSHRRLDWSALGDVSPALQAAVVASEDRRFFRHSGVDGAAVVAAAWQAVRGASWRGASTITMQLAAQVDPEVRQRGGPRRVAQKWRQMRVAWAIERQWSKSEILEAYLNLVTFRGELQGISAAARVLFGKAPHGLTAAESLVLAVAIRSPNAVPAAVTRRAVALSEATGSGVGPAELERAVANAAAAEGRAGLRVVRAPHLARQLLTAAATRAPVRAALDGRVQAVAEEALRNNLAAIRDRHVADGAVLVVDNASGEVLAYVGGSGDLSAAAQVDAVRARRQAGSALKPFLYGLAFQDRVLTPASLLEDTPLEIAVGGGLYRPENYDERFRGLVSARTALAASLNVPAVRTLALVGADRFVGVLRQLGFAGLIESGEYYGPALALGSAEVSLWDLVNAYRALANGGRWSPLRLLAKPAPAGGERQGLAAGAAFLVADILADPESRSPTFGLDNVLATRVWSAVKTGTSKNMRDNWCVGFSQRYTVGVWVGNASGAPMRDVSGVSGAAPVWRALMDWLHGDVPGAAPAPPAGVLAVRATPAHVEPAGAGSGVLRQPANPPEWFLAGTEPAALPVIASGGVARVESPVDGTVIALDPDIPAAQQRVAFAAHTAGRAAQWVLDGVPLGDATAMRLWAPQVGRHRLTLVSPEMRPLDSVTFSVRGSPERS